MLRNSTSYGLANTSSFRRASKMLFGTYGSNLQNPSPRMMEIYHPKQGYKMVQGDQAGAEALIVAYLCKNARFRSLFLNGIKSHTYVAAHIFRDKWARDGFDINPVLNSDISSLPSNGEWGRLATYIKKSCEKEYFIGKKSCHSFNYRMRPPTYRQDVLKESEGKVALSKEESETFYTVYHKLFPEISLGWWQEIEYQVNKTGYLFNLFGYPRYCQGPYTDKTWRELTAFIPQSTVGCITAIAFCMMQEYIEKERLPWNLLNDKHDSIMTECPEDHVEHCATKTKEFLEQELTSPRGEPFKMKAEIGVGRNWRKWSKENPDGIMEYAA